MFDFLSNWFKRKPVRVNIPPKKGFEPKGVFKGTEDEPDIEYIILSGQDAENVKSAFIEAKVIEIGEPSICFGADLIINNNKVSVYVPVSAFLMDEANKKAVLNLVEIQMREQFSKASGTSTKWPTIV